MQGNVQIAFDESGGPTDGNIYVTQNHYRPTHTTWSTSSPPKARYLGQVTAGRGGVLKLAAGVAVDPAGVVYISGNWRLGTVTTEGIGKCHPERQPTRRTATAASPFRCPMATCRRGVIRRLDGEAGTRRGCLGGFVVRRGARVTRATVPTW